MKKIKKLNESSVQSISTMANCDCGSCTCRYCNVATLNPHEVEVGDNSIDSMTSNNYWGS